MIGGMMLQVTTADPIALIIVGAFVAQAVATWAGVIGMRVTLKRVCDDMTEMHAIHPRSGNPGRRHHDPSQFCGNSECLERAILPEEE